MEMLMVNLNHDSRRVWGMSIAVRWSFVMWLQLECDLHSLRVFLRVAAETANSSLCWMLHYTKKKKGEDRIKYLLIKQKSQNQYCCSWLNATLQQKGAYNLVDYLFCSLTKCGRGGVPLVYDREKWDNDRYIPGRVILSFAQAWSWDWIYYFNKLIYRDIITFPWFS